jgi:hypothetical protein
MENQVVADIEEEIRYLYVHILDFIWQFDYGLAHSMVVFVLAPSGFVFIEFRLYFSRILLLLLLLLSG